MGWLPALKIRSPSTDHATPGSLESDEGFGTLYSTVIRIQFLIGEHYANRYFVFIARFGESGRVWW